MSAANAPEYVFELSGGALCLDFANTVSGRNTGAPVDHFRRYADLVAWARQAGLLAERQAAELDRRGEARPAEAGAALAEAVALREALFRLFAAVAGGGAPAADDLAAVNRRLPRALARQRIAPSADGFAWSWRDAADALDPMLDPVLRSAADLLTGSELGALRECASDACRWLFLDRSRNQSRRWCDMKVCGNRAKARRHYRRRKSDAA
jgi:predicted RNA-binding Zn ribbon-like protein